VGGKPIPKGAYDKPVDNLRCDYCGKRVRPDREKLESKNRKIYHVDFYEAAARVKRARCLRCVSYALRPTSAVTATHGSREVWSSFYSRSSGASGARRRMRGVEGWGRHLCNGARTAAKSTYAFTHPSNLREARVPLIALRTASDFSEIGAPLG